MEISWKFYSYCNSTRSFDFWYKKHTWKVSDHDYLLGISKWPYHMTINFNYSPNSKIAGTFKNNLLIGTVEEKKRSLYFVRFWILRKYNSMLPLLLAFNSDDDDNGLTFKDSWFQQTSIKVWQILFRLIGLTIFFYWFDYMIWVCFSYCMI